MKKIVFIALAIFIFINNALASVADTMMFGAFGKVTIYQPEATPNAIVLFVSGDGGWNLGVIDMAKNIATNVENARAFFPGAYCAPHGAGST